MPCVRMHAVCMHDAGVPLHGVLRGIACHVPMPCHMHACAQKIDVSKEDPGHTADRLVQFLKIVKYKPPASLDP